MISRRVYRVTVHTCAKRLTRHVRATSVEDAKAQALTIARALESDALAAVLGPPVVLHVDDLGPA